MQESNIPRSVFAPTSCRRYQLEAMCSKLVAPPGKAFLGALARKDRDLEIHYLRGINRWVLYRVTRRGGCAAGDTLIKEFALQGPNGERREPGWWLIEVLQRFDKTEGGTVDPARADALYLQHLDEELAGEEARKGRADKRIAVDYAKEAARFCLGVPRSVVCS